MAEATLDRPRIRYRLDVFRNLPGITTSATQRFGCRGIRLEGMLRRMMLKMNRTEIIGQFRI